MGKKGMKVIKDKHCFDRSDCLTVVVRVLKQWKFGGALGGIFVPMAGQSRGPILFSPTRRTSHSRILHSYPLSFFNINRAFNFESLQLFFSFSLSCSNLRDKIVKKHENQFI